jgi:hypothetical protein
VKTDHLGIKRACFVNAGDLTKRKTAARSLIRLDSRIRGEMSRASCVERRMREGLALS